MLDGGAGAVRFAFDLIEDRTPRQAHQFATEHPLPSRVTLTPRGLTALLEVVGRAMQETGALLRVLPEVMRHGLVALVIATDGGENSRRQFIKAQVSSMTKHEGHKYSWKFIYLGANQDAFTEAGGMGVLRDQTTPYNADLPSNAQLAVTKNVFRARSALSTSLLGRKNRKPQNGDLT
jgi:hypothetical protein